jgi:hypothetical protein
MGAVKLYVAASSSGGAAQEKERQDETQFITKSDGFLRFQLPSNAKSILFQVHQKNEHKSHVRLKNHFIGKATKLFWMQVEY